MFSGVFQPKIFQIHNTAPPLSPFTECFEAAYDPYLEMWTWIIRILFDRMGHRQFRIIGLEKAAWLWWMVLTAIACCPYSMQIRVQRNSKAPSLVLLLPMISFRETIQWWVMCQVVHIFQLIGQLRTDRQTRSSLSFRKQRWYVSSHSSGNKLHGL